MHIVFANQRGVSGYDMKGCQYKSKEVHLIVIVFLALLLQSY